MGDKPKNTTEQTTEKDLSDSIQEQTQENVIQLLDVVKTMLKNQEKGFKALLTASDLMESRITDLEDRYDRIAGLRDTMNIILHSDKIDDKTRLDIINKITNMSETK